MRAAHKFPMPTVSVDLTSTALLQIMALGGLVVSLLGRSRRAGPRVKRVTRPSSEPRHPHHHPRRRPPSARRSRGRHARSWLDSWSGVGHVLVIERPAPDGVPCQGWPSGDCCPRCCCSLASCGPGAPIPRDRDRSERWMSWSPPVRPTMPRGLPSTSLEREAAETCRGRARGFPERGRDDNVADDRSARHLRRWRLGRFRRRRAQGVDPGLGGAGAPAVRRGHWRQHGGDDRPLLLGDDESIERIVQLYRNPQADWTKPRGLVFFWPSNPSFYALPGLEREMRKTLDRGMLERIAAEDASGRALIVNTTNVDFGDMHAWDIIAEAKAALAGNDLERVIGSFSPALAYRPSSRPGASGSISTSMARSPETFST